MRCPGGCRWISRGPARPTFAAPLLSSCSSWPAPPDTCSTFFPKSPLDRRTIVGTKAVTQVAGQVYRIAYFGSFEIAVDTHVPVWGYAGAIVLACAGTSLAGFVLLRMTESGFRVWSRRITIGVALSYLVRGFVVAGHPLSLGKAKAPEFAGRPAVLRFNEPVVVYLPLAELSDTKW